MRELVLHKLKYKVTKDDNVKLDWSFDIVDPEENGTAALILFYFDASEDGCYGWAGVDYPMKGDPEWRFWVCFEDEKGFAESYGWKLSKKEKESIKAYVRNFLGDL